MPGRGSYGPGGAWIYRRAKHIRSKNPDMDESTSFAIATQQAHKLGKSPKKFRTEQGVARAHAKYRGPTKMYKKTASAAFFDELEKIGGWREGLKTLLTGRIPLYHGTSTSRADRIIQEGLKPQAREGVTKRISEGLGDTFHKAEKGLVFATRKKGDAELFARNQAGLERLDKVRDVLSRATDKAKLPEKVREIADFMYLKRNPLLIGADMSHARQLGALPGGKRIIKVDIPRTKLKEMEGIGTELHKNPMVLDERARLRKFVPKLEGLAAKPFLTDVPIKGEIPTKFIRGSKDYQKLTLGELKEHAKQVVKEPKAVAKDVIRSTLGISHSPGTLIRQGKNL